jgi:aldose 1-epimerase
MAIENLENRAVPAGLGLHPFFTRDADTELACRTRGVWRTDAEVLPLEHIAVPPEWNFTASRPVEGIALDNCFDGWDGHAMITWPRRGLRLDLAASEPFRHLVIYVPKGRPFFCVEPVSHASGAVGRSLLAAGATLAGEISLRLSNL